MQAEALVPRPAYAAFPGGKGGRCVRLRNLPLSCAVVMKSGNLNFLEPSGPFQACIGTALPFQCINVQCVGCKILSVFICRWPLTPDKYVLCMQQL